MTNLKQIGKYIIANLGQIYYGSGIYEKVIIYEFDNLRIVPKIRKILFFEICSDFKKTGVFSNFETIQEVERWLKYPNLSCIRILEDEPQNADGKFVPIPDGLDFDRPFDDEESDEEETSEQLRVIDEAFAEKYKQINDLQNQLKAHIAAEQNFIADLYKKIAYLKKEKEEAKEYDDEDLVLAINNQINAYSLSAKKAEVSFAQIKEKISIQ